MKEGDLTQWQAIQSYWEEKILGDTRTPSSRLARFLEEVEELRELDGAEFDEKCKDPVYAKLVGFEACDTIIVALGLIDSLGLNAENLFNEKMEITHRKYNIAEIRKLIDAGNTPQEAMAQRKQAWNSSQTGA